MKKSGNLKCVPEMFSCKEQISYLEVLKYEPFYEDGKINKLLEVHFKIYKYVAYISLKSNDL